ncbi:MAG: cell surface protein [Eubacterium sp.]|nr:cell surface protein [Eubacterium sp.]
MKKKRILVVYIPLIAILVVIIAGFSYSKQSVQKSISFDGEKTQTPILDTWNRIMAKSANKDEINVIVDKKEVKYVNKRAYMSRNMNLMIPLDIVIETFNCAANVYGGEKIVIEKGSSIVALYLNTKKMIFNDNEYSLDDKPVTKDGTIFVPANIFAKCFAYDYDWNSKSNTASFTGKKGTKSYLPKRYSYLDKKRAVPAKNQGNYGTCWAFATLTAIETSLMPEEQYDFSENNLARSNDMSGEIQDGGDYIMSMAYLMAWKGPVLEQDDPYGTQEKTTGLKAKKHIQEAQILPEKDYDQIKEMVYKYGGVESSMYMSLNNSKSKSVYYNESEYAYCYKGKKKPNHDVVIIGWDDNYSKELFNDQSIPGDGAFICMNSWGEDFGYKGTFYVSYYDDRIGTSNVCYTGIENTDNYDNIYQSDICGWTGSMGFEGSSTVYFANVYNPSENGKLQAVGFYAVTPGVKYEVFVDSKFEGENSLSERTHTAASGTLKNKGYYTIKLDKPYSVKQGQKFSVTVKITSGKDKKIFKLIPVEMNGSDDSYNVDLTDGEGYFSSTGNRWQSSEKHDCNICLKAYTDKK